MIDNLFKERDMILIVSLAENSMEMLEAVLENGADAVKVHANVTHRASGNFFPSVKEQRELFEKMIKRAGNVPVGLVPGDSTEKVSEEELALAEEIGFDFISVYAHHAGVKEFKGRDLVRIAAFDDSYDIDFNITGGKLPIEAIELSIMHKENYGDRLTYKDLFKYYRLRERVELPIIVPTQKEIQPEEVKVLKEIGVDAVMIGAVVTGKTAKGIAEQTKEFKNMMK